MFIVLKVRESPYVRNIACTIIRALRTINSYPVAGAKNTSNSFPLVPDPQSSPAPPRSDPSPRYLPNFGLHGEKLTGLKQNRKILACLFRLTPLSFANTLRPFFLLTIALLGQWAITSSHSFHDALSVANHTPCTHCHYRHLLHCDSSVC